MRLERKRAWVRQQLMRVAVRCFARNGYGGTPVDEICLRAGCSKGAFYFHFRNKGELLIRLLSEGLIEPPWGRQRTLGLRADRVLVEAWAEARHSARLRRESARQLRATQGLRSRSIDDPGVALASALWAGLVVHRVVHPPSLATDTRMLARIGMEAAAA